MGPEIGEPRSEVDTAELQLPQATEERVSNHPAGDLLRLAHDQARERHAGHDNEEEGERHHERRRQLGSHAHAEPLVHRCEDGVEDRDADEASAVGGERDDERRAEEQQENRGALVIGVDERHAQV